MNSKDKQMRVCDILTHFKRCLYSSILWNYFFF